MRGARAALALLLLCVLEPAPARAQDEESAYFKFMAEEARAMSLATGRSQSVRRAPAVGTVITAQDIAAIGATDIDEVLETVPGLHVSRSAPAYAPIYTMRGIRGAIASPHVLLLVNGIPMNTVFLGDGGLIWGGLPVDDIARVEVIRGPGSALYGAEAFAGVINIVTKTAADVDGTQIGARGGSNWTRDAWVLHGGRVGPLDVKAYFRAGASDGSRRIVSADNQSGLDVLFGTSASRAPGPINAGREAYDGSLDLAYEAWRLRGGLKQRDHVGSGAGVASALDPTGRSSSQRLTADLTYNRRFASDWDVSAQGSFFHYREFSDLVLFPPGAFGGAFPGGVIGNPYKWERHWRFDASAVYTGFADHGLRLGAGHEYDEIYRIRETKNFAPGAGVPVFLGSVVDVSDTAPFLRPHDRRDYYLYLQDEWAIARNLALTAGVRHDRYSDFGHTNNPRAALVWDATESLTAKALYGRAFRAPSFTELYNINNPVNLGTPGLKPETIQTMETAFIWRPHMGVQFGLNLFRYEMRDIIRLVPNSDPATGSTSQNIGGQIGRGLELEGAWDAARTVRLSGNYAYQRSIDSGTGKDAGEAPRHHVNLRGHWLFCPGWTATVQHNWIADRRRAPADARPPVADYHTVDLSLSTQKGRRPWEFLVSVRNAFDADAREPSTSPGLIPNDLPLPGRAYIIQASWKF
jgi:iron complex outermembrane receptor protein